MKAGVLKMLAPEMELIEKLITKYCRIRSGYLGDFAHLNLEASDRYYRPACVVLSARIFNKSGDQVNALGSIVQLIFLAAKIHEAVPEDYLIEEHNLTDPRDGTQLPVLVGDYLYGRFFTTLCDAQLLPYLKPLSEIICVINEGSILRFNAEKEQDSSQKTLLAIIEQETAALFAGACRLSSILAEASETEQAILAEYGHNLGMAYGVLRETGEEKLVNHYAAIALTKLKELPDNLAVQGLRQLVNDIIENKVSLGKTMVG